MLVLMARSCLRVGEVLKLTPNDILDRKLILNDTKSGKEAEVSFLPQKVADRLKNISVTMGSNPETGFFRQPMLPPGSFLKRPVSWSGFIPGPDRLFQFSSILHLSSSHKSTAMDLNQVAPGRAETP
jgi:integrase